MARRTSADELIAALCMILLDRPKGNKTDRQVVVDLSRIVLEFTPSNKETKENG